MTARRVRDEYGHLGTVRQDDGKGSLQVAWDDDQVEGESEVAVWVPFRMLTVVPE